MAGPYDWPGNCHDNGSVGTKQQYRLYSANNWSGSTDYECGNFWKNHTIWGVWDESWGSSAGFGGISGFNDKAKSAVLMNKSKNHGACFTFYWNDNFNGGTWEPAPEHLGRPPCLVHEVPVRARHACPPTTAAAVRGAQDHAAHDTKAECESDTNMNGTGNPAWYGGYKTLTGNIVQPASDRRQAVSP